MDYGKILAKAFEYALKYKSLWILGFFASFFGGSYGFANRESSASAAGMFFENTTLIVLLVIYALILFFLFIVMHLVRTASLIDAISKLEKTREYKLKESFKAGTDAFWSFLGLWLIIVAAAVAVIIVLAVPTLLAFYISTLLGILILLAVIPATVVAFFVISTIYAFAQREIIIADKKIGDAVIQGYILLRNFPARNIVIFLITFVIGLIMFALNTLLVLLFAMPLIIAGVSQTPAIVFSLLFIEVPIFIAIAILITGSFGTFQNSIFTIYYMELIQLPVPSSVSVPPASSHGTAT